MKYVCLGYMDPKKWEAISASEQSAFVDDCFAYDDVLRKNGHFVGGEALQGPQNATTLRFQNGKVFVTDGLFAETKEQLAGFYMIEAKDLNEAIQIGSKIPPARVGSIEVRPIRPIRETVAQAEATKAKR